MSLDALSTHPGPDDRDGPGYRQAPHNLEAEQELLGAILVNNEAYDRISTLLLPEHFYEPLHGRIYARAADLITKGHIANPVTLKAYFEQDEALAEAGGPAYLAALAGAAAPVINVADYGHAIYEFAQRRALIRIGTEMVNTAFDAPDELAPRQQIEQAEQSLFRLAETGQASRDFQGFDRALSAAIDTAAKAYHRDGDLAGVATGLLDLDHHLGGLHRSDLLILAGRPSMGKTALVTNIGFNVARAFVPRQTETGQIEPENGGRVGFFSLEMSAEQLATRILSEQTEIYTEKIRKGQISEDQFDRLAHAAETLEKIPFYIDDTPALTISALTARARRLKRLHGLDLVIVDYLQLVRGGGSGNSQENRVQEISAVTQGLKALAKELDVPVIALSQLSRQVESRDDKRPQLSDLRESGSIEQDADVVMFVFREEYYVQRREPREGTEDYATWQAEMEDVHGLAEVIIGKHRNGPTGTVRLSFQGEFTRFGNLAKDDHLPEEL